MRGVARSSSGCLVNVLILPRGHGGQRPTSRGDNLRRCRQPAPPIAPTRTCRARRRGGHAGCSPPSAALVGGRRLHPFLVHTRSGNSRLLAVVPSSGANTKKKRKKPGGARIRAHAGWRSVAGASSAGVSSERAELLACGRADGRNGSVNLVRTSTTPAPLAKRRIERLLTAFQSSPDRAVSSARSSLPGSPPASERGGTEPCNDSWRRLWAPRRHPRHSSRSTVL